MIESDGKKGSRGAPIDPMGATESRTRQGPVAPLSWLATEKVTPPDRVAGYLHREELLDRILPVRRRTTLLTAPGGFGKTVLLAESCRGLRNSGVVAAWLTLDANDAPQALDAYLAFAFQAAGLDVVDLPDLPGIDGVPLGLLPRRTSVLLRAVENCGGPCVLALDELEQLQDPASFALLDGIVKWGPANLHMAIACREIPNAFDIASSVLAGRTHRFSVDDLRFSTPDVARFFGSELTDHEVASLARESRGWPIALRMLRNEGEGGELVAAGDVADVADNWVESRLWRSLLDADREMLLDVGLFERIDAALLNEVLEVNDAKRRVEAIPALAGLLESVGGAESGVLRLHPLIREHCARQRFRESPRRFRRIHRGIAKALARRGETVSAVRHAAETGDSALVGEILEGRGGVRLWQREGLVRLQAVDRFVTEEVVKRFPRTALAHCIVLLLTGQLDPARKQYAAVVAARRATLGDAEDEDMDYVLDDTNVRAMLCLYGCERLSSDAVRAVVADQARLAALGEVDPIMRGAFEQGVCVYHNLKAEFDAALDRAERAERCLPGVPYGAISLDLYRGQVAMARGEVEGAGAAYGRALATARAHFLRDQVSAARGEAFMAELNLERNRIAPVESALRIADACRDAGTTLASYAAIAGVVLDGTLARDGIDQALSAVAAMQDYARTLNLPAVVRYLAGECVSLLVIGGHIDDAEEAWRADGLPEGQGGCLDLEGQSWRELESVACARLRLLTARRQFEMGRTFLADLVAQASSRSLRRTWMRALALGVSLERQADRPEEAEVYLKAYLDLFMETDYARPVVRERESLRPALEELLDSNPRPDAAESAERLLGSLDDFERWKQASRAFITPREMDVLKRLEAQTDREIAAALNITRAGVRFHVGNIFRKLNVGTRLDAVGRARDIGHLP